MALSHKRSDSSTPIVACWSQRRATVPWFVVVSLDVAPLHRPTVIRGTSWKAGIVDPSCRVPNLMEVSHGGMIVVIAPRMRSHLGSQAPPRSSLVKRKEGLVCSPYV